MANGHADESPKAKGKPIMNPTSYMVDYYLNGYEIVTCAHGLPCLYVPRWEGDPTPWVTVTAESRHKATEVEPVKVPALV